MKIAVIRLRKNFVQFNSLAHAENYNPETLSEIADRTVKLTHLTSNNKSQTSTPKQLKHLDNSNDSNGVVHHDDSSLNGELLLIQYLRMMITI